MTYTAQHLATPPKRETVDALRGLAVLEFGTPWCPHCQRAQPFIEQALAPHADVDHIKVEDGPGQRLGRSFGIKLWPTVIALRDGQEVARVVRPQTAQEVIDTVAALRA